MKLPQSEKTWIAGGLAGAVILAAAAWFGAINPQLSSASALRSARTDAETQNMVLLVKTNKLRSDSLNLNDLSTQLAKRLKQLPTDSNYPELTAQLYTQAAASHVSLSSISIGAATVLNGAAAGAATSRAPGNPAGRIFTVPVAVVSSGTLAAQKRFLDLVQHSGPRAALVTTTKILPGANQQGSSVVAGSSMTTSFTIFVAPQSPAVAAQLAKQLAAGTSG
jgi:HPt (histidine-containing phosphotransfer) domain-containing protein